MNELQIFENKTFGEIRTLLRDGEPWFVAADVCRALDIDDTGRAIERLDEDEGTRIKIAHPQSPLKSMEVWAVNEPGLYSLVLGSRKLEAKAFKRWITHDVIPSIRKTGAYSIDANDKLLRAQAMLMNAQNRRYKLLMQSIGDKALSPIAVQVFGLKAFETVTGMDVGDMLPQTEKTYSATEVGATLGISANKVGSIANRNGLKTDEFGIYVLDKSRHSSKEVSAFRYNKRGVEKIQQLLSAN